MSRTPTYYEADESERAALAATEVIWLQAGDVAGLLSYEQCIDLLSDIMVEVSRGNTNLPLRWGMPLAEGGLFGMMPGALQNPAIYGIKIISLLPGNPARGLPSHLGLVVLFDAASGRPVAIMSGSVLTAIRTAAASALATRHLAREDARVLTIVGSGEEARTHIDAVTTVRPIEEVRVWGRTPARARKLAERYRRNERFEVRPVENLCDAMRGADIVCTVTAAAEPVVAGGWLEPGMHLNVAGSGWAHKAEVDPECVRRSRVFVDYRASALTQAGELIRAFEAGVVKEDHIQGEIGQVIMQAIPGRTRTQDITLYKSVGIAAQDLAPAWYLYSQARERDIGARLHL